MRRVIDYWVIGSSPTLRVIKWNYVSFVIMFGMAASDMYVHACDSVVVNQELSYKGKEVPRLESMAFEYHKVHLLTNEEYLESRIIEIICHMNHE